MDYDLFQSDDDEEILTAFLEATQPAPQQQESNAYTTTQHSYDDEADVLPEFNCSGRDTLKTHFASEGFIRNGYALHDLPPRSKLHNLAFDFSDGQLQVPAVLGFLLGEACKNVQKLYAAVAGQQQLQCVTSQSGWYKARQQVTHCYHLLLHSEHTELQWTALRQPVAYLRELLNNNLSADSWRVLYFAENSKGNECNAPAYHLYHGVLEWRILDLCLLHKYELQSTQLATQQLCYAQLERTLDELILCASYHHHSKHSVDLLHSSAFMCRCIKECWLLLQQLSPVWLLNLSQVLAQQDSTFWSLFNKAMQRYKTQQQQTPTALLASNEFHAWLRLSLVRLQNYSPLGQPVATPMVLPAADVYQTGACLQQFLSCQPDEQQRRVYLCLLAPLQLQLAQPSTDILCQLWECFNRTLNCNFQSSQPQQLPLICASGSAYVERYRTLLAKPQLDDLNQSSFTIFALLLGKTLQLLPLHGQGNQVQKVLGRIFSKFSAAKLLALNESGIHHVIELFLCLLLTHADFAQLAPKLREMLLCLALEKLPPARRLVVAKGHVALLLLHAERRQPLDDYVGKLMAQLAAVRYELEVAAIYATALEPLFEEADDFARGEHLLLGPWLTHYIEHSPQAAQDRIWQALHLLFEKLRSPRAIAGKADGMVAALLQHVLPLLRLQYTTGYSTWLPKVAADFAVLDKNLLLGLLQGTEPANTAASAQLLLQVLTAGTQAASSLSSSHIIQVWVKSLVLLTAQHEAVVALTPHVVQLPEFHALHIDDNALASREPLCAFFGALGRRAQEDDAAHLRMQLSHKLHSYVAHFERWLPAERMRQERPELGARFYSFLAIVIYNCATLAYVRSKPSCFFHLAMTRFLLPTQLQAGQPPEGRLPQLVHKIFPVLLQGIGRLPYKTDSYLGWALQQLIVHWTPHFTFSPSIKLVARPYVALLQGDVDGQLAQFVLQLLVGHFLAVQRRQAGTHAGLAISLLQQLIVGLDDAAATEQQPSGEAQLLTLLKATHIPLLEHVMFVDELEHSRAQVLCLYRQLAAHAIFERSELVRAACAEDLRTLASKHLAHCTYFYFQMLSKLAEEAPALVAPLLPYVREEARSVELKRGAGEDAGIRKCLLRLQQVLQGKTALS